MAHNSLKIAKWGNGQGIRLPMAVMKLLSLKVGDELPMKVQNETIVLVPKKEKKLALAERFANYDGPTEQKEIWSDEIVGKEEI